MVQQVAGWRSLLIGPETSIVKAIEIIDSSGFQIVLVVDRELRLLGTVTDGDIRRGLLKGITLQASVDEIMNREPKVGQDSMTPDEFLDQMRKKGVRQLPVLNTSKSVVGLYVLEEFLNQNSSECTVVIMAGGKGTRLYPLTKDIPKPMLKVGSKPILETILENFVAQGFRKFFFSVNFKASVVKDHFGDGSRFGASIRYLEEATSMGTAGSLGLLPEYQEHPLIVMNGDLLTKVNFRQLLDFHHNQGADATMCVREYEFQVPYGVVMIDEAQNGILSIDEKPTHKFFVNGGIYVLNPNVLQTLPKGERLDMTAFFEKLIGQGHSVAAFPVREYWIDIGRLDDLEKAQDELIGASQ